MACSLDIEVSSFMEYDEKYACMYLFGIGVNGRVIIGRTYKEMISILDGLCELYELNQNKRLIIYIHNLSYE